MKIDFCLDFIIVIPKLKNLTELQLVDVDENTFEDIELNDALPCNSMPQLSTFVFVNREDESLAHCVVAFGKASPNLKTVKLQLSCQTYSASTFQEIISNFSNLEIFQFHLWGSHLSVDVHASELWSRMPNLISLSLTGWTLSKTTVCRISRNCAKLIFLQTNSQMYGKASATLAEVAMWFEEFGLQRHLYFKSINII